MHDWILEDAINPEERRRRSRELYGLPPEPPVPPGEADPAASGSNPVKPSQTDLSGETWAKPGKASPALQPDTGRIAAGAVAEPEDAGDPQRRLANPSAAEQRSGGQTDRQRGGASNDDHSAGKSASDGCSLQHGASEQPRPDDVFPQRE